MEAFHLIGIIMFGLTLLLGTLLLIVAAFSESALWGLLCLLIPGATLAFIVTHWERARSGAIVWSIGVAGFVATSLTWTPKSKADATPAASAIATPIRCPPATATDGFTKWCCDGSSWAEVARGEDCDAVFRPSEACDATSAGALSTTACSSAPNPRTKKRRSWP